MTTHTATYASTAITSSEPAPCSSSNSNTTPQQLHNQLQQILRRHEEDQMAHEAQEVQADQVD